MKNKYKYLVLFIPVLLLQCKTTMLGEFGNMVKKSTSISFINSQEFNKCRDLMLNTFSANAIDNDSIIILEYFADGANGYSCTIYESKEKLCRQYSVARSIKNGAINVDSLKVSYIGDKILPMIINGQLNEVKKRGDKTTITPATFLIINILTKNKNKSEFNIKTIETQAFLP